MSETLFDPEYGQVASPKENGISDKRDRSQDLEDFCVETIVFENKESILDAVLGVSKGDTVTSTFESEPQTIVEDIIIESVNGHTESPSADHEKENVVVSEFQITDDIALESSYPEEQDHKIDFNTDRKEFNELDENGFSKEVYQKDVPVESCLQKEEVFIFKDNATQERTEVFESKFEENQEQEVDVIVQRKMIDGEDKQITDGVEAGAEINQNYTLHNGHELTVETEAEVCEEKENAGKVVAENVILGDDVKKAELVGVVKDDGQDKHIVDGDGDKSQEGGGDILTENGVDSTDKKDGDKGGLLKEKEIEEEIIIREDTGHNVLNFIRKKTRSLGRNGKNGRLSSKSDEGQLIETTEKSKKKNLFKMFTKERSPKESGEEGVEEDHEDGLDVMSKSYTKMETNEIIKQDKKPFKFFKNVFHKSDKKTKTVADENADIPDLSATASDVIDVCEVANVSTDNVVPAYQQPGDMSTLSPAKLFTITELESEKVSVEVEKEGLIPSESVISQEGYQGATELHQGEEEVFQQMVNSNLNDTTDYPIDVTDEEDKAENKADETADLEVVSEEAAEATEVRGVEVGVVVVEDEVLEKQGDREAEEEQQETPELQEVLQEEVAAEVCVESSALEVSGAGVPEMEEEQGEKEVETKEKIKEDEKKREQGVDGVKAQGKEGEEEVGKKMKKKNFVITLPSFKFAGFSRTDNKDLDVKKEKRLSVDDLDNVTAKDKKVKKRTKSFHFGRKAKKVDEDLLAEVEKKEEIEKEKVVDEVGAIGETEVKKIEKELNKSEPKSKFSTLKWKKFSKKTDKKDEVAESKEGKDIEANKEEDKNNTSKMSRQSRQGTLTRSFLKLFSRKAPETKGDDLNGMVYSLEDNMVIAADKSLSIGGSYESGQVLQEGDSSRPFVVVAIDFGTTFSGYAFSFMHEQHSEHHPIHIMRKWEGGDPGVNNQKTPTIILLTPNQDFHTFGFTARDFYHNLDVTEASKWLYFDKFKMALHNMDIHENLTIPAANGVHVSALKLFSFALNYFKLHAIKELTSQSDTEIKTEDIRWVITVPAIWKAPAKQFMRKAAHLAEITSYECSNKLLIALEPEAASIYIRRLKRSQLMPERPTPAFHPSELRPSSPHHPDDSPTPASEVIDAQFKSGTRYIVVDCGGGTVDLTVHEMEREEGLLKELYKATGGPYGSTGVDLEFEQLLRDIFGSDFIDKFKLKRPAGWVDLMIAFESRKRTCSPFKDQQHNISMPFSFIDFHKKFSHNTPIDDVVRRYNNDDIKWSPQGMLRLSPGVMSGLFDATVTSIISLINNVIVKSQVKGIEYLFLVGGFSESPLLQTQVRRHFEQHLKVIIPQDVSLTILRGAVCYGLDPTVVSLRRSHLTYGIGVVHKFVAGLHDPKKLVRRDGVDWCADVFDGFVQNNQPVALNDSVVRRYAAIGKQDCVTICVYSSEEKDVKYVTDPGVSKCATLTLKLDGDERKKAKKEEANEAENKNISGTFEADVAKVTDTSNGEAAVNGGKGKGGSIKQLDAVMTFGDTEIKVTALEVDTGKSVKATIDFLNL